MRRCSWKTDIINKGLGGEPTLSVRASYGATNFPTRPKSALSSRMTERRKQPRILRTLRIPYFHPIPIRARRDGWTADRQCAFIGHLFETRCVAAAARRVGMARETAYRLRSRAGAEGFAHAWDLAMVCPEKLARGDTASPERPRISKVTLAHHHIQWTGPLHRPVIYRGQYRGIQRKADFYGLLRLVRRLPGKRSARRTKRPATAETGPRKFARKRVKRSMSWGGPSPFPPSAERAIFAGENQ